MSSSLSSSSSSSVSTNNSCTSVCENSNTKFCQACVCDNNTCTIDLNKLSLIQRKSTDVLLVKKLNTNAILPAKQFPDDAGYDLSACIESNITLEPHQRVLVGTGIATAIPPGCYGRIAPRSGLAWKNGIDVLAGVIDSAFRAEIKVILYNTSNEPFTIKNGDRIAQLIIEVIKHLEIEQTIELPSSQRNLGGFGSTGV